MTRAEAYSYLIELGLSPREVRSELSRAQRGSSSRLSYHFGRYTPEANEAELAELADLLEFEAWVKGI